MPTATDLQLLDSPAELAGDILAHLKQVLLPTPAAHALVLEDGVGDEPLTEAAVLFPIVHRQPEPTVLLTQRTAHLKDHPGQISFPGGRCETSDASPADTALREAAEEIGLAARHIKLIGYLPEYCTGTGFRITPVVGLVTPPFDLSPDAFEVAEVFEVPFSFLLDTANHKQHSIHYRGQLRHYHAIPYQNHYIWGATAGMIVTLHQLLSCS